MLAASRQRRVLSGDRPNLAWRGLCQRRAGCRAAGQIGDDDLARAARNQRDRALSRVAAGDPDRGAISGARNVPKRGQGANHCRVDRAGGRNCESRAAADADRRRALDRSHIARSGWPDRRESAAPGGAVCGDVPAGMHSALDRPSACHRPFAQPLRAKPGRHDDRRDNIGKDAARRSARSDRGEDRWRAAVRGGADQERAGIRSVARGERRLCPRRRADAAGDPLRPCTIR
jgi:hypothetical protein